MVCNTPEGMASAEGSWRGMQPEKSNTADEAGRAEIAMFSGTQEHHSGR